MPEVRPMPIMVQPHQAVGGYEPWPEVSVMQFSHRAGRPSGPTMPVGGMYCSGVAKSSDMIERLLIKICG